jgi:hypothetical protein
LNYILLWLKMLNISSCICKPFEFLLLDWGGVWLSGIVPDLWAPGFLLLRSVCSIHLPVSQFDYLFFCCLGFFELLTYFRYYLLNKGWRFAPPLWLSPDSDNFHAQKLFNLMQSHLSILAFIFWEIEVLVRIWLPLPISSRVFPIFL